MDLAEIVEHIPGVMLRLQHEEGVWRTLFVTKNIEDYGYDREDLLGGELTWCDLIHPDDRAVAAREIQDYEARGIDDFRLHYRLVCRNGDVVPVSAFNVAERDGEGRLRICDVAIANNFQYEASEVLLSAHHRQLIVLNDILMSLHDSDLDNALQIILDKTGEYLDTSRVVLFQDSPDHKTSRAVYEWCNTGIPSIAEINYSLDDETSIPEVRAKLREEGQMLVNYGEIPEKSRREFELQGVIASAFFSVYLYGRHYGFVCFDDCVVRRRWDEDTARFLRNVSNLISTVLVRQRSAEQLRISQRTCETVLHNVDSYIFVLNPHTNGIIFANHAFERTFGKVRVGNDYRDYFDIDLRVACDDAQVCATFEVYSERAEEWLNVSQELVLWIDGQDAMLVTCYDMTEKRRNAEAIERIAYHDALTGLPNRYRCDIDLRLACQNAQGAGKNGTLFFIDMDDFKIVNDSYGHDYGDAILVGFADYLSAMFHGRNKVFRFGGDEFVILIDPNDADRVREYLDALLDRASRPWQAMDKQFFCTLSIGVVMFSGYEDNVKSIIKNADIAMYEAKRRGKNSYEFFEAALGEQTILRTHTETALRRSMRNNFEGFELHYQPVMDIRSGRIIGVEALLRMTDESGSVVMPKDFIPLAEYLGFMAPIGDFVLESASRLCKRINESGNPSLSMTVNISEKQLFQKDIGDKIEEIVRRAGALPSNIRIAMNEGTAVGSLERMKSVARQLRARGIGLVLDDFGGGNASFMRLKDLPLDLIKTAPSFMENLNDEYSRGFLQLVVDWSHAMGKLVCINGVENLDQFDFCKESGADYIQGFYYHVPYRADALEALFRAD